MRRSVRHVVSLVAMTSATALATALVHAKEYGHYDIKSIVSPSKAPDGQQSVTFNLRLLNQVLEDLGAHAGTYPPSFDSNDDRHRAESDVMGIANLLDPMASSFARSPDMLLRLGLLHTIGHNLDLSESDSKANAAFKALLALSPDDPRGNLRYGMFLAGTTKVAEAVPYLEKAKSLGILVADYPLGIAYVALGDKTKALENLQSYSQRVPSDENAIKMIEALREGNVEMKHLHP